MTWQLLFIHKQYILREPSQSPGLDLFEDSRSKTGDWPARLLSVTS